MLPTPHLSERPVDGNPVCRYAILDELFQMLNRVHAVAALADGINGVRTDSNRCLPRNQVNQMRFGDGEPRFPNRFHRIPNHRLDNLRVLVPEFIRVAQRDSGITDVVKAIYVRSFACQIAEKHHHPRLPIVVDIGNVFKERTDKLLGVCRMGDFLALPDNLIHNRFLTVNLIRSHVVGEVFLHLRDFILHIKRSSLTRSSGPEGRHA